MVLTLQSRVEGRIGRVIASEPAGPLWRSAGSSVDRSTPADIILCITNRFWDLMPLRRDQKLLPHFGEAGTAVFAVEEVEYGGHDPVWSFELICTFSSNLSFFLGSKMSTRSQPCFRFRRHGAEWKRLYPAPSLPPAPDAARSLVS